MTAQGEQREEERGGEGEEGGTKGRRGEKMERGEKMRLFTHPIIHAVL